MKTSLFTGWQARFHAVCLMMLLSALAVGAFSSSAHAQAQVTPAPSETVAVEPLPATPEATAAPVDEAAAAATFDHGDVAWMLTSTLLVLLMVVP
ncbi:MAG: ammonia channel protein, partial [Stenotrophomonas bentonitica]